MQQTDTIPCGVCEARIPDMDTWLDHMESHSELDIADWQRETREDYLADQDEYDAF